MQTYAEEHNRKELIKIRWKLRRFSKDAVESKAEFPVQHRLPYFRSAVHARSQTLSFIGKAHAEAIPVGCVSLFYFTSTSFFHISPSALVQQIHYGLHVTDATNVHIFTAILAGNLPAAIAQITAHVRQVRLQLQNDFPLHPMQLIMFFCNFLYMVDQRTSAFERSMLK